MTEASVYDILTVPVVDTDVTTTSNTTTWLDMEMEDVPVGVDVVEPVLVDNTDRVIVKGPGVAPLVVKVVDPMVVVELPLPGTMVEEVEEEIASWKLAVIVPGPPIMA